MSDRLGFLQYGAPEQEVFLGHSVTQHKNISEATAQIVDQEVRRLVDEAYETAKRLITEHIDQLDAIAKALLEYETLTGDELQALVRGEEIVRGPSESPAPPPPKKPAGRRSSVPTGGAAGGLDPEPQQT